MLETHNLAHSILKLFSILAKFPFTTSEVALNTKYYKHSICVASPSAERRTTLDLRKLGSVMKRSKLGEDRA